MPKRKTQEEFIRQLRSLYGDRYDYSGTTYEGDKKKVSLTCPLHGQFSALPTNLLRGHGCPFCGRRTYNDQETFIKACEEKFGDKYSYEKVNYVSSSEKVLIHCNEHDFYFGITPNNLMRGRGCPKCSKRYRYTTDEIIEKFKEIHGDKYDYSNVVYKNMKTPISVTCPEHGDFSITPLSHIHKKAGCIKCGYEKMKEKQRATNDDIIKEFQEKHGAEKYDYSKVSYINSHTLVLIHCNKHDYDFRQSPDAHKRGVGCPRCNERILESIVDNNLKGFVHYIPFYKPEWLNGQSLDFYIPDKRTAIECQGIQHYKPTDFAGKGKSWAESQLASNMERDSRKRRLCEENGVELIYFTEPKLEKYEVSGNKVFTDINALVDYIRNRTT